MVTKAKRTKLSPSNVVWTEVIGTSLALIIFLPLTIFCAKLWWMLTCAAWNMVITK